MALRACDFVDHVRSTGTRFESPVRSLLDIDFYKLTSGQWIQQFYPDEEVTFELIVRDKEIPLATMLDRDEIYQSFDFIQGLSFEKTDLYYLRGMDLYERYLFREPYLESLKKLRLPRYTLTLGNELRLRFTSPWSQVTYWETMGLSVISELYYRSIMRKMPEHELEILYARAMDRLYRKFEKLCTRPGIRFAEFGTRRRHSFLWQEWALGLAKKVMGDQFTGTSNTWMAFHHNLDPIGTNPHELPMVLAALADTDEELLYSQYHVLELWQEMYGQGLRVFLPDTFGSAQFFKNAPSWLASWRGQRQDSGDPITEGDRYINWLKSKGEDPRKHVSIFSDGLDVDPMLQIDDHFGDDHPHPYGWGSLFVNDFRGCSANEHLRPFSMVCKVVSVNGRPCVKLSNNVNKATGFREEVERYQRVFGDEGRISQETVV